MDSGKVVVCDNGTGVCIILARYFYFILFFLFKKTFKN